MLLYKLKVILTVIKIIIIRLQLRKKKFFFHSKNEILSNNCNYMNNYEYY